jgi:uncharacterized protein involved in outer membrane biogenesis
VEERASAALGRQVGIQHLHVGFGRRLTVRVDGVRIGPPTDFGEAPPLADVVRVEVEIEPGSLFGGRMVLPRVTLNQPALALLAGPDGRANYRFGGNYGGGGEPPVVGRLEIADGTAQVALATMRADFRVRFGTEGDAIIAIAEGRYAGQPIHARFTAGALLSVRDTAGPWPMTLELANGPTRLTLQGTVAQPLHLAGADLKLELAGPDLQLLAPLTGVPFATTPPFRVAGQLDYADGRARFSGVRGQIGRSDIAGEIGIAPGATRPLVTAALTSHRLDPADLGGFIGSQPGRRDTPGQTQAQREALARAEASPTLLPDTPLDLPRLRAADVRATLRAERFEDQRVPLDALALDVSILDGAVRLDPVRIGVGQGYIGGKLVLTPRAEGGLVAHGSFELRRVDVARLLAPMGVRGGGALGGVASIDGTGASLAQLLGNGNGALTVAMVGGNLSALVVDLSGLQFGRALLSALGLPTRTSIGCLVGDFVLRRGMLETRTFVLDTDNSVITGSGTVDLGREALDLRLRTASKGFTIGSLPTSISVTGRFKSPRVLPDAGELVARGGVAAGLGLLALPLAVLPTIQLGVGEQNQCEGVVAAARRGGADAARRGAAGAPQPGNEGGGRRR